MPLTVLATKLYIPPPPSKAVPRPHLLERLSAGLDRKLTLIAAPAGCGKTTLLSAWIADLRASERQVAWLSLDASDSDPARFLTYLVAALRTIAPNIGEAALEMLESSQSSATEPILTALLNEISIVPHNFVLVLDDYHLIDAIDVDQGISFLLDHLPPQMHLVITSREDPQMPLARLRSRGQMTELRVADLRFSKLEAAEFLHTMGLYLSAEDVAALEERTEGWIAGLQLAAISMQGHQDAHDFIRSFAGDHRYITDYLVEEVLQRQPESVRSFLLKTSILDRLNGPLCDAVTGQVEGSARLEALQRGNFFVVPLDDKRHWYRYHHLFAEVLRAHLMAEQPDQIATLHGRASEWYEQTTSAPDAVAQAIRHALAARDFDRAANLVERAVEMRGSRQESTLLGWLKALPDQLIQHRPVLSVWYAHALLAGGELDDVEAHLLDAERWLQPLDTRDISAGMRSDPMDPAGALVVVDEEEFRHLPGVIAIARAGLALALGNVAGTIQYARQVLELVSEDDYFERGSATTLLGLASWASGDLEAAYRLYGDGMADLQKAGRISNAIGGALALADIRIEQGRLREAMSLYERGLQLATEWTEQDALVLREAGDMYVGMSEIHREQGNLDAAMQHLQMSKKRGEHTGSPQNLYRWRVAMARIRQTQGDLDGALDLIRQAERVYVSEFYPNVRPVAAMKARVWVMQGRLGEALAWAREQGLSVEDSPSYLREFEHITLARMLMARYKSERTEHFLSEAAGLLERLLQAANDGGRAGSVIEILILQALIYYEQGDMPAALVPLQRALMLAEPEGYVRIFVDEGVPMSQLLRLAADRGIMPSFTGKLLSEFGAEDPKSASSAHLASAAPAQPLIEPLSERELDVLRLLRSELSGPEVAHELMVSLSTMRTHTRNIYNKLGVDNRRAAVRRAEELHLL